MEAEAAPFISKLGLDLDESFFPSETTPFKAYRGQHEHCELTVITNGKDDVHGKCAVSYISYLLWPDENKNNFWLTLKTHFD